MIRLGMILPRSLMNRSCSSPGSIVRFSSSSLVRTSAATAVVSMWSCFLMASSKAGSPFVRTS